MKIWLILLLGGLATYLTRLSMILLFTHWQIPPWLGRALRLVPAAVFSAIIAQEVFIQNGGINLSFHNERILAALAATLIAWRTKHILLTLGVGMATLWALQAFFH
ncbi:MAG: AzlD domain-containing protein [Anaerolineales bacterium]|nr:AzlD domain-containing protein [Anaerolineales bacterium]MCS7249170.1 AzlD domain-containing protein [Anaerolineales bacterium]MDW8162983.1 AzlD domain-containing protein [Anaerolineales bacterium]MDW8446766.1 AzlD domain-containing protein [Anaerolineales bacterium]